MERHSRFDIYPDICDCGGFPAYAMTDNFLVTREFRCDRRDMCHYFVVSYDQCCNTGSITSALFLTSILQHRSVAQRGRKGLRTFQLITCTAITSSSIFVGNHIERPPCKYLRHISCLMGTSLALQIRFAVDRSWLRKSPWRCVTIRGAEVIFERNRKPAFSIVNRCRASNKYRA